MTPQQPLEDWYTIDEAAAKLKRSPKTIRNLVSQHQLPRRLIRKGRNPTRITLLSEATVRRLREMVWGAGG